MCPTRPDPARTCSQCSPLSSQSRTCSVINLFRDIDQSRKPDRAPGALLTRSRTPRPHMIRRDSSAALRMALHASLYTLRMFVLWSCMSFVRIQPSRTRNMRTPARCSSAAPMAAPSAFPVSSLGRAYERWVVAPTAQSPPRGMAQEAGIRRPGPKARSLFTHDDGLHAPELAHGDRQHPKPECRPPDTSSIYCELCGANGIPAAPGCRLGS